MANGAVHKPPGIAARGLITWAVDLWPYVNGKALFAGLELREMEVSDMLDVVHYFFEEDMNYITPEQANSHGQVRQTMYRALYGVEYSYFVASRDGGSKSFGDGLSTADGSRLDEAEDEFDTAFDTPFNPKSKPPTKSYFPPTELSGNASKPFGGVLDSPMGF